MRYCFSLIFSVLFLFLFHSCTTSSTIVEESTPSLQWPTSTQTSKPWTRWWWHGNSVTKAGITTELESLQEAGFGGVELTSIYGQQGDDHNFIDFLSPEWVDLMLHTLTEAERLGMGVDMATGTGWPFGGPWVDDATACKYLAHRKYEVKGGRTFSEKIEYIESPILREVHSSDLKIEDLNQPISENDNLQHLAIDQVRFEKPLPLLAIMAYNERGDQLDLTDKVSADHQIIWRAPAGQWTIYALFEGLHGKMVERAGPGGEGNVIDHFSKEAINRYLEKFDSALKGKNIQSLRAFFNDSYEVDDARGQSDWTPDLLTAFQQKRGYDLRDHIPALMGDDSGDTNTRVLADYRETVSDLILETFTTSWDQWADQNGAIVRNQAHGSPANILDLYAASDIPETEGTDIIGIKMASSAAHLMGNQLTSAEAATWLGEHFTTSLSDLKENVDRYIAGGVNHIVYHGTCYSPTEAEWPGRLFYAAIHANPRNPLWNDWPVFNEYISRTQAFMQSGQPDNDVLVYWPVHDRFATERSEKLEHFYGLTMGRRDTVNTRARDVAEWLQSQGYAYDFVSDKILKTLQSKSGMITNGSNNYKCIVVPQTEYMPIATLQQLSAFAEKGIPIIFHNALPQSVPGQYDIDGRMEDFQKEKNSIKEKDIILESSLDAAFQKAAINRESLVDNGLEYNRRSHNGGHIYFINNWSDKDWDGWITLSGSAKSVSIYNPLTGHSGKANHRTNADGYTDLLLQLNRGESIIIKTSDDLLHGPPWKYIQKKNNPATLEGKWQLSFLKGGPTLPMEMDLTEPALWTSLEKEELNKFSGTAKYSVEFSRPNGSHNGWILDLGDVSETANVSVNGHPIGTAFGPVYQYYIPKSILQKKNTLEVEVTNLMANRIVDLEKSGKRWQQFYNINISARLRENLGDDRVFTTKNWSPKPSGLKGPVTLTAAE